MTQNVHLVVKIIHLLHWLHSSKLEVYLSLAVTNVCINDNLNNGENTSKILGVYWNQNIYAYQYNMCPYDENTRITMRVIVSEIVLVFDPLGL